MNPHANGNPRARGDPGGQEFEGGEKPQVVQNRRAKFVRQTPQLHLDLIEETSNLLEAVTSRRRKLAGHFLQGQMNGSEKLSGLVMERVGDPFGFLLQHLVQVTEGDVGFSISSMGHLKR